MKKKKYIFLVLLTVFILVNIAIVYHMSSNTTAPWKRKKKVPKKEYTDADIRKIEIRD